MRAPTTSGGGPVGSGAPRDPQGHLDRTHRTRLGLVYLTLEAVLTPLHLALCAALLHPWVALANVLFFGQELLRVLLLGLRFRIGPLEAARTLSGAFVALPSSGTEWLALLLVYVARALAMLMRYRCSFGAPLRQPGLGKVLLLGHAVAGLLMSVAFLIRAGGFGGPGFTNALTLPHHFAMAMLAGVASAVWDAHLFYARGVQSSRGEGPFRQPPPPIGHRLLARGFDQGLFEVRHFVGADAPPLKPHSRRRSSTGSGGNAAAAVPMPRYARMLFPPLPDPPHDLPFFLQPSHPEWVKWVGREVLKRAWLLFEASEMLACLRRAVLTCAAVTVAVPPVELLTRVLVGTVAGRLEWGAEDGTVGSIIHWGVFTRVASTALSLSLAVYSGLALSTLLLYHILAQPVDFSNFPNDLGPVLQYWLEKGWTVALQDARPAARRGRRRHGDELGEEELWREALEDSQRVLHRVAVLSNGGDGASSFPPQIRPPGERRLSVADRLYRAHAFMDLAILAHTSAGRRRGVFADLSAWNDACRPCLAVINALTLQLELQMEASARVEGGAKSPLVGLHSRLGLAEPREAASIARLMVEGEVLRRLESVLARKQRPGGLEGNDGGAAAGGKVNVEGYLLPVKQSGWPLLQARTLAELSVPLLDLQVVEMASLALAALYRQAVAVDRASGAFEDSRGASRHSIPAVLAALLSCQLAIHLYSSVAMGQGDESSNKKGVKGSGVRFTVMRDRPSVVLPQFCDVSAALDRAVEQIVVGYYDSDFASFAFAPLYARLIKIYVEALRDKEVMVDPDAEGDGLGGGYSYGSSQRGMLSPSSPPRRRG